jgi:hypothetical protein
VEVVDQHDHGAIDSQQLEEAARTHRISLAAKLRSEGVGRQALHDAPIRVTRQLQALARDGASRGICLGDAGRLAGDLGKGPEGDAFAVIEAAARQRPGAWS